MQILQVISGSPLTLEGGGGGVYQSAQHTTLGKEVAGSIPTPSANSLLVGSVSIQSTPLESTSPKSIVS